MSKDNNFENAAAVITGKGQIEWVDEPISKTAEPGKVLVKTYYSLISPGTELSIFQQTNMGFSNPKNTFAKYPFRPGYAAVGRIVAVGEGVTDFHADQWVFHRGRHRAYAMVHPADDSLLPLPENVEPKLGSFARMAQIAASALEVSSAVAGDCVAVLGLGLVGNLAAQWFRIRGCRVIGVDLVASRCAIAERCGIQALHVTSDDAVESVRAIFAKTGATTVIEATGHPQAVPLALKMTARGGETILLGSTRGTVELNVYELIHSACLTVRGAHECVLPLKRGSTAQRVLIGESLEKMAAGQLTVAPLLSEVMNWRQLDGAYRRLADQPSETLAIMMKWAE